MVDTLTTAKISRNVNDQQKQMAIIAHDYLHEPLAVNDIGLVSLYSTHYVLDLYGLGSPETLRARTTQTDSAWMSGLMDSHHVEQAMIYDEWFALLRRLRCALDGRSASTPRVRSARP